MGGWASAPVSSDSNVNSGSSSNTLSGGLTTEALVD